jgi:small subunit ribosomal protein S1
MAGKFTEPGAFDNPQLDDSWWDSVMADESRHPLPRHQLARGPRPVAPPIVMPPRDKVLSSEARPFEVNVEVAKPLVADWERARRIYDEDQIVALKVSGHNRGGLLVEAVGLHGFVPFSHLVGMSVLPDGEERDRFLATYQGRELRLKIIECAPDEARIVFSERAARADAGCRNRLFNELKPGDHVSGEVTNITDFGVFVDLGGVEGLIHISELSWGRVVHPTHLASLGQQLEVLVLDVSAERCRVALSLKRLQPNPWEQAEERHAIDSIVPAEITTLSSYGAFARLEEGLEGLIHSSEIPLPAEMTVKDYLGVGQKVDVRIIQLDAARQRLGLSLILNP